MIVKWHGSDKFNTHLNFQKYSNIALSENNFIDDLYESDILITDYSSVFIDYLLLEKPIIFYSPDLNKYNTKKGFNYEYKDIIPGVLVDSWDAVIHEVKLIENNQDKWIHKRKKIKEFFHEFDDGYNSKRIYEFIKSKI